MSCRELTGPAGGRLIVCLVVVDEWNRRSRLVTGDWPRPSVCFNLFSTLRNPFCCACRVEISGRELVWPGGLGRWDATETQGLQTVRNAA
jgi:hypothetical protein